jgi:hypothetical protein
MKQYAEILLQYIFIWLKLLVHGLIVNVIGKFLFYLKPEIA